MVKRSLLALSTLIGQSAWTLLSFFIASLLVIYVIRMLWASDEVIAGDFGLVMTLVMTAAIYALTLLIVVTPMLIGRVRRSRIKELVGLAKRPNSRDLLKVMWIFPLYFAATVIVTTVAQALFSDRIDFTQAQDVSFDPQALIEPYQLAIAFVALVVIAPIAEELLFRGYLFGKLRTAFSFWPAALASSALFGLVHGQWNVAIDTFVLGMFLSYLREATGSVWPAVLLHALKNGLAFTLLFVLKIG